METSRGREPVRDAFVEALLRQFPDPDVPLVLGCQAAVRTKSACACSPTATHPSAFLSFREAGMARRGALQVQGDEDSQRVCFADRWAREVGYKTVIEVGGGCTPPSSPHSVCTRSLHNAVCAQRMCCAACSCRFGLWSATGLPVETP